VGLRLGHEPFELREEDGILSGGGRASGPLSFMKGFDAFAGVIKSGGKTRRAAKMVILNADHPDIESFIWCKAKEEKKAQTLIEAGYDSSLDGDAYGSIFFQNANNSVRATDEFMEAVDRDDDWWTKSRVAGQAVKRFKARGLMRQIAEATHQCGDPGMQFDTTVNRWHTSKNTARINASNPCSEYMFLDDSACNLASLNLMKFVVRTVNSTWKRTGMRWIRSRWRRKSSWTTRRTRPRRSPRIRTISGLWPGLRKPRRAADVDGHSLRFRSGPGMGGIANGHHVRAVLSDQRAHRQ